MKNHCKIYWKEKKQISVDPQYFPQEAQELPPEYDDDEVDYGLDDEDMDNEILNDLGLQNYDSIDKVLNQPEMKKKTENISIRLLILLKREEIN